MLANSILDHLIIRRAKREDIVKIVTLLADDPLGQQREQLIDPLPQSYYDAFTEIDNDKNNLLIIAELNAEIVGTLQVTFITHLSYQGKRVAQIESVRVDKQVRNLGIGAKMLSHVIQQAKARNCHRVQLTTNKVRKDAQRFYARLGFVGSHEGMKLDLANVIG